MPLVALITNAVMTVKESMDQVSAVHLTAATIEEAKSSVFIFCGPEIILGDVGRSLLLDIGHRIQAVFVDEFHIIAAW